MRIPMLTVTFFLIMQLSLIGFCFMTAMLSLGILAYAFGADLPDWKAMVKYWKWTGITLVVTSIGFFVCKGLVI